MCILRDLLVTLSATDGLLTRESIRQVEAPPTRIDRVGRRVRSECRAVVHCRPFVIDGPSHVVRRPFA